MTFAGADSALVVGLVLLGIVGVILFLVLGAPPHQLVSLTRLKFVAVVGVAAVLVLGVVRAETPLGIGDGVVPNLVAKDRCSGEQALAKRNLRWRYGSTGRVGGEPCDHIAEDDPSEGQSCADAIEWQRQPEGSDLGEGGVVELRSTYYPLRGVGCA